ncbi:putative Nmd5, karyopherin, a carrier protein [Cryphonectria parasitica EP155]|uniref:Nmd5, karyopherin, a carrier protein n=1 Tax=Cryphonectria parasitica (strain ATCC 38755 / EP155) TaxID=660469 RepID=A0A9P4XSJ8_CRYP1|nr:putative Nmd5, karyopherin, a carrier protein [Cryphonectria parasitica EP155]KAF3760016.1 putative Nmd5, karyopherin, a carrier protein [Cryphonectria parasitica EP155]
MDAAAIRNCIVATLDADANVRKRAELQLKQAEEHNGFLDALLQILQSEQEQNIRLSTVIYLKNRVNRAWAGTDHFPNETPIPEDEKARVRDRLLPILASSQGLIRPQLIPILQRILHWDFPDKWPTFMDFTIQLLNTNDAPSVLAGLQCLLAICRAYRFKASDGDNKAHFDKIVEASFPRLLAISTELVSQESEEAGEMLHIALKAYKHATWLDLAAFLREQQNTIGWCTVFLQTVSKAPPAIAMGDDPVERERHHWWKAKKWAYFNLNRLYIRHGNPHAITKDDADQMAFANFFAANIAPEILKHYLQEIEKWVSKTSWLSRPCLSYSIVFMDECVRPKEMWAHLRPHLTNLVTHFIFPVLCLSQEDLEKFEDEPEEYLHRKLNFYEEVSAPDVSATNFLVTLTKNRRKQTFELLSFVNSVVSTYETAEPDKKDHISKEGALRMIGTLAPVLLSKKSPIADQVEYFLVRYVFPDFTSPQGYLRARACDTIEKFEQLDFKDQNHLLTIYRNILDCMADPALPVRVTAALALQPLIRHDIIRTSMQTSIPTIMQQLLKLANEADIDALANVMEDFVEVFATELTPFAVALSEQLRDTYLRIVNELLERNNNRDEDDFSDFLDDKSITALGVLQTIGTLILTLESTPDVLLHIEAVLMPVVQITLDHKLYDLYNEVFEIIDSCTFAAKSISPTMWQAFELIHRTFKAGAELYLEDMLPALDNFVQFGVPQLIQHPEYVQALYSMVSDMFSDPKVGGIDRICACKLSEAMMLSLPGHIDNCVSGFISMAMNVLSEPEQKMKSYKIHLMEMVINAIYYNPILALQVLESNGWTNKFFSMWFGTMDSFTRVHDKKLCIVAIVALLGLSPDQVPVSVSVGWPRLLTGITSLFKTLPTAVKNREDAMKDDYGLDANYTYDDDDEWGDDDAAWTAEEEPEEEPTDAKDESSAYLEFLNEEAQKFGQVEEVPVSDDELGENSVLLESPLDKLEPYQIFRSCLMRMQQEQPQFYTSLSSHLSGEEQSVIQNVVQQAEANQVIAQQAAQQLAAAAQQANGGAS